MCVKKLFNLSREDLFPTTVNHVLYASLDTTVAILTECSNITGQIFFFFLIIFHACTHSLPNLLHVTTGTSKISPSLVPAILWDDVLCFVRLIPVALHDTVTSNEQLSRLAQRKQLSGRWLHNFSLKNRAWVCKGIKSQIMAMYIHYQFIRDTYFVLTIIGWFVCTYHKLYWRNWSASLYTFVHSMDLFSVQQPQWYGGLSADLSFVSTLTYYFITPTNLGGPPRDYSVPFSMYNLY